MEPRIRYCVSRREFQRRLFQIGAMSAGISFVAGCTTPWTKEKPSEMEQKADAVRDALTAEDRPVLVRDVAATLGKHSRKFESFGLVTDLAGTGGDIKPSTQREYILNEMRANDFMDPVSDLASPTTAVVQVVAIAPAGLPKGNRVDAEVTLSRECDATSLRNGKLYDARLQEYAVLGNSLRRGAEMARAQGPIINLPIGFTKAEAVDWKKGRIIGGAKIYDQRMMGIHIRDAYAHVMTSNALAKAINDRFVVMELGKRRGAAVPKDDGFIQIDLPRKYIHDPYHFLDVILHVGFLENDERRNARMEEAGKMLYEPTTARSAALQFEAMGTTGRKALMVGLASSNPEIRFYTAYSLAYLDEPAAIPVLESLAIEFPEFRAAALIGLTVIDHYDGRDSLERLLQHPDGEVRYGALIAMRKREDGASMISSRDLKDVVRLSEVPSQEPFIAVSLEEIPEIAIFGMNPPVNVPSYLEINPRIVIRPDGPGMLRMVHFQPDGDDYAQVCKADLVSVLDTLQQVGGTYNDMIHFIDDASRNGALLVPVGMNPRPKQGRVHHRNGSDSGTSSDVMSQDLEEIHQVLSEDGSKKSWWDVRRFWPTGKSE